MLADFRARGGRLKLNYDNLPKGPVITYDSKKPLPLKETSNGQNGSTKTNTTETESPRKKPVKVPVCLNNWEYKIFLSNLNTSTCTC